MSRNSNTRLRKILQSEIESKKNDGLDFSEKKNESRDTNDTRNDRDTKNMFLFDKAPSRNDKTLETKRSRETRKEDSDDDIVIDSDQESSNERGTGKVNKVYSNDSDEEYTSDSRERGTGKDRRSESGKIQDRKQSTKSSDRDDNGRDRKSDFSKSSNRDNTGKDRRAESGKSSDRDDNGRDRRSESGRVSEREDRRVSDRDDRKSSERDDNGRDRRSESGRVSEREDRRVSERDDRRPSEKDDRRPSEKEDRRPSERDESEDDNSSESESDNETSVFDNIPRTVFLKLIKKGGAQSVSTDASEEMKDIIEDFIKYMFEYVTEKNKIIESEDVKRYMELYLEDVDGELPEDTVLPRDAFEKCIQILSERSRVRVRRDAIYLIHLFSECIAMKVVDGALLVADACRRSRVNGNDLATSYRIYML